MNCRHCQEPLDEVALHCPRCGHVTPKGIARRKRLFIAYFVALVLFCAIAILLLPR